MRSFIGRVLITTCQMLSCGYMRPSTDEARIVAAVDTVPDTDGDTEGELTELEGENKTKDKWYRKQLGEVTA